MARIEQRGPFLMLFALNQQLSALLARAMADAPLTPGDFAVYSALRLMQPTTPTELAAALGMRVTTLSSVLAKMEALAHLKRQRNPADGRSRLISLTDEGVTATERCFPAFGHAISAVPQPPRRRRAGGPAQPGGGEPRAAGSRRRPRARWPPGLRHVPRQLVRALC